MKRIDVELFICDMSEEIRTRSGKRVFLNALLNKRHVTGSICTLDNHLYLSELGIKQEYEKHIQKSRLRLS